MAHITKFKLSGMGQIYAHVNRDKNQTRKYENADIDTSKTYLNYDLQHGDIDVLTKRLGEVAHTKRHDLVACCGVVVSLPVELQKETPDTQRAFFKICKSFLDKKFGEENCVYATVHNDETTPHLHYGFVPVVTKQRKFRSKEKKGQTYTQERVCAKEVVTKEMLTKLHDELQAHVSQMFPNVRVVAPVKAKRLKKNLSIGELKTQTAKQLNELKEQAEQNAKEAVSARLNAQKALEDSTTLSDHLERLSKRTYVRKKGHLGRVLVTEKEYNELVDKAESVKNLKNEREYLLRTATGQETAMLEKENAQLKRESVQNMVDYARVTQQRDEFKRKYESLRSEQEERELENQKRIQQLEDENSKLRQHIDILKRVVLDVWDHISDYVRDQLANIGIKKSRSFHR